jgi:hypothetical protein
MPTWLAWFKLLVWACIGLELAFSEGDQEL